MNERGEITTNTSEIWTTVREYYEQLCTNKLGNLEETDKLLETFYIEATKTEPGRNRKSEQTHDQ